MFKNYVKIAWRNLMKNKVFSLINVLGLTIGITVCLMIFLFIMNEFSMDNFHAKGKNIYRVMRGISTNEGDKKVAYLSGPYAPALLNDFPEIKAAVRVDPSNGLVSFGDKAFNEKKIYATDPDFFEVFSFPLVRGTAAEVLKHAGNVVLTETTAKKYFGSIDNAMGQMLQLDKELPLKVSGVAKDVPSNSHLDFDLVIPNTYYISKGYYNTWINNGLYTYVLLNEGVNAENVQKRLPQFMQKYMGNDMEKFGFHFSLSLVPVKDVYLDSLALDSIKHGSKTVIYIFLSIAILILVIACINFMNLSTVRAVERSKEVGLRKVMGAMRNHLVLQFIGESVLLTVISCMLSIGFLLVLMPYYNDVLGYTITVPWSSWQIYAFLAMVIVAVGFLAGSYPAFFLSAFSPVQALKGKLRLGKGGSLFRQALVVVQFSISVLLIIGTIIIMNQMSYVKNKQLGYNDEQTIIVPINNNDISKNKVLFKKELEGQSSIASVSLMSGEPGGFFDGQMFEVEHHDIKWKSRTEFADFEFVQTLGLKIIAGRNFSPAFATDSTGSVLINRTAASDLGWTPQQAVGKWIKNTVRDSLPRNIVGVVEDFNFSSLKQIMEPLVISTAPDRRVALVKLKAGNMPASIAKVKEVYSKMAPVYPFEYSFLDQKFEKLYDTDLRQQKLLSIFSGLAIFIACLGLFGLASFTAAKRTKEIGVRKVLGSSVQNILLLLSKDLLKPVMLATFIAMPLGYYAMHQWLQNFAYRTPLSWWVFFLAALITVFVAFVTVCFKAIKAAVANPVKSLRSE